MADLRFKELQLVEVGPFTELKLTFNPRLNLLCGPNGSGKTTILESLASFFIVSHSRSVKKKAGAQSGSLQLTYAANDDDEKRCSLTLTAFTPLEQENIAGMGLYALSQALLKFQASRELPYQQLNAISKDPVVNTKTCSNAIASGISFSETKSWFIRRDLFALRPGALSEVRLSNYKLAISLFSLLQDEISFAAVDGSTYEIMLNTPSGKVYLEYLSEGYKCAVYILLSLVRELDYRYPERKAEDFAGVVLIDELELHLHPTWQVKLLDGLLKTFPNAQFVISTHSPTLLQVARSSDEVTILKPEEDGNIQPLHPMANGLQGWSLGEIMQEVMEVPSGYSNTLNQKLQEFDQALNNQDKEKVVALRSELLGMLKDNSELKDTIEITSSTF